MPDGITIVHLLTRDLEIRYLHWNMPRGQQLWSLGTVITVIWFISLKMVAPGIVRGSILMDSLIPAEAICA